MIQSLFIFKTRTTEVLYNKNFQNEEKVDMFNSFFTTLKKFVSEMLSKNTETLNNIKLGEYIISTSHIPEAQTDLALIYDKEDAKIIGKIVQKFSNIITRNFALFTNPEVDPKQLEDFDNNITTLILSNKKLVNISELIDDQRIILKSIWEQRGALSDQLREELRKEKEELIQKGIIESNIVKKYYYLLDLIDLSEKMHDENAFIEFQTEAKTIKDELKDRKIRIKYYLEKAQEAIRGADYKQVYLFFYSFVKKLEDFSEADTIAKYNNIAQILTKKKNIPHEEYFGAIKEISKLSTDIETYFPLRN